MTLSDEIAAAMAEAMTPESMAIYEALHEGLEGCLIDVWPYPSTIAEARLVNERLRGWPRAK